MKIKNLFITLSLALPVGIGVGAGLSVKQSVKEVKADATNIVYVDVRRNVEGEDKWDKDSAKFAICYQDDGSGEYWTGFATSTGTSHVYQISVPTSIGFTPTKAFLTRQSSAADNPSWGTKYNQTNIDTTLRSFAVQVYGWSDSWYTSDVYVKGGKVGDWSTDSYNVKLPNIKFTNTQDIEIYGEVTIPAGTDFKTFAEGNSFGGYETHSSVSSFFSGDQSSNVACSRTGTYEVFFKYDQKKLYITSPTIAAADQWAQDFLGANCGATKTAWGTLATSFGELDSGAKAYFVDAAHIDHNDSAEGYINQAMQRYDYVLERFGENNANTDALGYEDFIGRVDAGKVTPKAGANFSGETLVTNNNATLIIIAISTISLLAFGGYFLLRKKREN